MGHDTRFDDAYGSGKDFLRLGLHSSGIADLKCPFSGK